VALDLGCGTGMFLEELEKRYGVVVGADISMEMLKLAKQRAEKSFLVLADADQLPFRSNCFDVVVLVTLLQNLPDPRQGLREIRRIIKTAGTLLLTALKHRCSTEELEDLMREAGFTVMKIGEIAGSEDIFCVARVYQ
jgi:ubiquinone/menaquinone biosynthesis C-methylase UbiE